MYLSDFIETANGKYEMASVFSFGTKMLSRRRALGYVEAKFQDLFDSSDVRGHEFHYSEIIDEASARKIYSPMYRLKKRSHSEERDEGFVSRNAFVSYVHLHFASAPGLADQFTDFALQYKEKTIRVKAG